jgi:acyl-CoA reductase-like NAD-dependent aldehyde dehydrogenase
MSSEGTPARETGLYFDGLWHPSVSNEWHQVRDPANGAVVGRVALACAEDVDRAVAIAHKARRGWETTHADSRAAVLHRAADLIDARKENIARTLTLEQGKPLIDSLKEINFGIQVLHYYAEEGRRIGGSLRPASAAGIKNVVSYAPVGVAAAIVPWNYPVDIYCWKVGPALAAGCPIIVKPPPETPFAIGQVVACFEDAGLPPGVLGNLPGTGSVAGAALSAHPGVALISATASIAAGQDIARRAAGNLKRLSLELGGHAPFIVLPDADIEAAASAAVRRSFSNMGQICIAVNRILVHRAVHAKFVEAMATLTGAIKLGNGLDAGVAYGPTLNDAVIQRTRSHLADALAKGGRLVIGGEPPRSESLAHGSFFLPTLVDDAPLNSLPNAGNLRASGRDLRLRLAGGNAGHSEQFVVRSGSLPVYRRSRARLGTCRAFGVWRCGHQCQRHVGASGTIRRVEVERHGARVRPRGLARLSGTEAPENPGARRVAASAHPVMCYFVA